MPLLFITNKNFTNARGSHPCQIQGPPTIQSADKYQLTKGWEPLLCNIQYTVIYNCFVVNSELVKTEGLYY